MKFKDDDPRLAREFSEVIDKRLRAVLLDLSYYISSLFREDLTITCLVRTPDENRAVGGNADSSHLDRRAADLRTRNLSEYAITKALEYVKRVWGDNVHIIRHKGGTADHIHVNINRHFVTPPTQG